MTPERAARLERVTKETSIELELDLERPSDPDVSTGIAFLDHMIAQMAKHSGVGLRLRARGDLEVDSHHLVEDTGIALGEALAEALGDKEGLSRFGAALVPLDEALAEVALDLSGRPFLRYQVPNLGVLGQFDLWLLEHFFQSLVNSAKVTLHVALREGSNPHHCAEAIFKAFGRALGDAIRPDSRYTTGVPSTKGRL
jgi:imidazoleglycerol-phosphate dehydratase